MIAATVIRVLIIGNSLTAANDLPRMLEAVARASGTQVVCEAMALPDFGLEEHWKDGRALRKIREGGWTHVVLQQGPTSLPESRDILIEYARKFAPEIRAQGARIVFYGVWPPRARMRFQDAVTASYAAAARETGGIAVPVGDAWQRAWREAPDLEFLGPDGFHPAPLGTYVAAIMLFEAITGISPKQPPFRFLNALPPDRIALIHREAMSAAAQKRVP